MTPQLITWFITRAMEPWYRFDENGHCPATFWEPKGWQDAPTFTALSFPG